MRFLYHFFDPRILQGQRPILVDDICDPTAIRTGCYQAGFHGVGKIILRSLVHDPLWLGYTEPVRHLFAPGQQRRDVEHERGLAFAGVTLQYRQFPVRDIWIPKPLDLALCDRGKVLVLKIVALLHDRLHTRVLLIIPFFLDISSTRPQM